MAPYFFDGAKVRQFFESASAKYIFSIILHKKEPGRLHTQQVPTINTH
jgi:hypothetical protein